MLFWAPCLKKNLGAQSWIYGHMSLGPLESQTLTTCCASAPSCDTSILLIFPVTVDLSASAIFKWSDSYEHNASNRVRYRNIWWGLMKPNQNNNFLSRNYQNFAWLSRNFHICQIMCICSVHFRIEWVKLEKFPWYDYRLDVDCTLSFNGSM